MTPNASAVIIPGVPELDDETLTTWRAFLNAHARVTRAISRDLAAAGLPDLSWYDVLWALYRRPLRVKELAEAVVLSPTAMSRFVDRVEKAGYVHRTPDPDDRRALQITITDEGRDLLRRMWPIYSRGIEEHFGGQSESFRAALERMG
jgi:DNA-binding MarR family transcriptional regulator